MGMNWEQGKTLLPWGLSRLWQFQETLWRGFLHAYTWFGVPVTFMSLKPLWSLQFGLNKFLSKHDFVACLAQIFQAPVPSDLLILKFQTPTGKWNDPIDRLQPHCATSASSCHRIAGAKTPGWKVTAGTLCPSLFLRSRNIPSVYPCLLSGVLATLQVSCLLELSHGTAGALLVTLRLAFPSLSLVGPSPRSRELSAQSWLTSQFLTHC